MNRRITMELDELIRFIERTIFHDHTEYHVVETPDGIILVTGNNDTVLTFNLTKGE
jgi:hypothetical protein